MVYLITLDNTKLLQVRVCFFEQFLNYLVLIKFQLIMKYMLFLEGI